MAKYIGDRPTWLLTNQRWDNIDPNAVVSLVHQSLVRMWGNLVGPTWGCLTRPTFDTTNYLTNGNHVAISACVFGYVWESLESGAQDLEGGPVIYDPDRDIQAESTIYIPPAYASEGVWLWFKRFDGPAETDMRAYRPGATEDVAATATQYKEYVKFEALPLSAMPSTTTINEDQGWFRFARLPAAADDGWTAGVPDGIQPLSFWDGWYTKRGTGTTFTALNTFGKFMYDPPDANATSNTRHGLAQVLQAILNQLAIILDTTNIRDNETEAHTALTTETADSQWHDRPARGLTQLSADLAAIEAADLDTRLTAAEADITELKALHPVYACTISGTNVVSSERYGTPTSPLLSTVYSGGICTITFNSGLGAGLKVDYTSIPQVTARDHSRRLSCYWDSQYVLLVKSYGWDSDTLLYNSDFYLTINGSYV